MKDSSSLPPGFESLEPFVQAWSVAGAANRARLRATHSESDRIAFFDAAKDQVAAALAYLDRKPLDQFDDSEQRLMNLLLSLSHVAMAVEVHGEEEARHEPYRNHMRITRASADTTGQPS